MIFDPDTDSDPDPDLITSLQTNSLNGFPHIDPRHSYGILCLPHE